MDDIEKNYFSIGQMRNALLQIEDQMVHSNWMPNIILGINRGGCIPGVYLSHRLKVPHEALDVRLRDHTAKPNLTVLEKAFAYQKKILILDDINDSGATFEWIKQDWENNCEPRNERWKHVWHQNVRFAVLTNNLGSSQDVDFYVDEVNKEEKPVWLVYPWE